MALRRKTFTKALGNSLGPFLFVCVIGFVTVGTGVSQTRKVNQIDKVRTVEDVEQLLESIDHKRFDLFTVSPSLLSKDHQCQAQIDRHKPKAWEKADFDGNGLTDLLVNTFNPEPLVVVVMSQDRGKLSVRWLADGPFENCAFALISESAGTNPQIKLWKRAGSPEPVSLYFKFGDFFEVSGPPKVYKIEQIRYETFLCFGNCAVFELVINGDRTATFDARQYNDVTGNFRGTISQQRFDELVGALNNIDFPSLENKYSVPWTDDQKSILTIRYDGGKTKKIEDYGLRGSFGLRNLYKQLFDLRASEAWTKQTS